MMLFKVKYLFKVLLVSAALFLVSASAAQAVTSFQFSVPEGQGGGNEFYRGRCVRASVELDTDGNNTGGADLVIDYDNTMIQIVQSNCSTAATAIYTGSQYDNYTNNSVTATQMKLGAYNNPGNAYNGSGTFAYFYFTVLTDAGNYDLDYDFTPTVTTDCNLAEYGTGNDILDQANDYTLSLIADSDTPTVSNRNPDNGAINVAANTNVAFRLNDGDAGVDISTLAVTISGLSWGSTNYTEVSGGVSYSCHTTNANRVDYCDVVINPSHNFYYTEVITVVITTISDLGNPVVHTLSNHTYSFTIEDDNDAPQIYNRNPNNGQGGVSTTTNVNFNLRDLAVPGGYPGTGVNISTLSVTVSAPGWGPQVYTSASPEMGTTVLGTNDYGQPYDYSVSINPAVDFPENVLVSVSLTVDDYGVPAINTLTTSYSFTTADTEAPECSLYTPDRNSVSMGTADHVTFHCTDSGTGVDIDSLSVVVDMVTYTRAGANIFAYSGDSSDYFITVDPAVDFALNYALETIINVEDLSNNAMVQVSYGLATGTTGTTVCPTPSPCPSCPSCDGDDCAVCEVCAVCPICEICPTCLTTGDVFSEDMVFPSSDDFNSVGLTVINGYPVDDITVRVRIEGDEIIFEGEANPNILVAIMIESEPIILVTTSDEQGQWRIRTANILPSGSHDIYAISIKGGREVVNKRFMGSFEVVRPKLIPWWVWVILAGLVVVNIWQYRRWKKLKDEKEKEV